MGCNLIVHRLGIEVVAIFHHAQQYLIDRTLLLTQQGGFLIDSAFLDSDILQYDFIARQGIDELHKEIVLTIYEEWREGGVVIVPAPAFTPFQGIFHRVVGDDTATDGVNALLFDALGKGIKVSVRKRRVKATYTIEVAMKSMIRNFSFII